MNILAVDDEKIVLDLVVRKIKEALPEAKVHGYDNCEESLEFLEKHKCDIAFLDINMKPIDGVFLAKKMQAINPKINIIFLTGYPDYALEAMQLRSSGYILKPPTVDKIKEELMNLRNPIGNDATYALKVCCFGNFEVYDQENQIVKFSRKKTKELFAYLIDRRGASVTASEICAVIWEEESDWAKQQNYFYKLCKDLKDSLEEVGADHVLVKSRNSYAVIPEYIDCDYYLYLESDPNGIRAYNGEYMSQYSWAEVTRGSME